MSKIAISLLIVVLLLVSFAVPAVALPGGGTSQRFSHTSSLTERMNAFGGGEKDPYQKLSYLSILSKYNFPSVAERTVPEPGGTLFDGTDSGWGPMFDPEPCYCGCG